MMEEQLAAAHREEISREIEANRTAGAARKGRRGSSVAAEFAKEVGRDFVRLAGVFRVKKVSKRKRGSL